MLHRALRLIRIFHEITQKELAQQLGISPSHVSEIEAGKKKPSYDLLEKYASYFNVPVSNIIFFSEYLDENNPDNGNYDQSKIESKINKLRVAVAGKIISMMEFVVNKYAKEKIK